MSVNNAPQFQMVKKALKRGGLLVIGSLPFLWLIGLIKLVAIAGALLVYVLAIICGSPAWLQIVKELLPVFIMMLGFCWFLIYATRRIVHRCTNFIKKHW